MMAAQFRAARLMFILRRSLNPSLGQALPGLDPISLLSAKVCYGVGKAISGGDHLPVATTPGGVQEIWQRSFSDPTQWWDNRRRKEALGHPDFGHKKSKEALWLTGRYKPAWVDPQLVMLENTKMSRPPASVSTSGQGGSCMMIPYEGNLEAATCWKLCEVGHATEAVDALNALVQGGCHLDTYLFYGVLKKCMAQKDLVLGRRTHALLVQCGFEGNAFLATHLIGLYASHGKLEEALGVFIKVTSPSAYTWASIVFAYARHGEPKQAIGLYRRMRESGVKPDNRVFVAVLKACGSTRDLVAGKDVHAHILDNAEKPDIFVQNCLVDMYVKCGQLNDARRVFDRLFQKNVVTWTSMIAGYAKHGLRQEAFWLYSSMQDEGITSPNAVTFVCLLQACASTGALNQGKQVHADIEERGLQADVVLGPSLVSMYARCGSLKDAQRVFDRISQKDVVSWNAMIACYAQQGMGQEALSLYREMQKEGMIPPDCVTFVCLLQACAGIGAAALHQGKQLHAQIEVRGLQVDVIVGNSLLHMYARCGSLDNAQRVFDSFSQKDAVTWNVMIAGYAQQGTGHEAFRLYGRMQQEGLIEPDSVTFVCLLQACTRTGVASLPQGKQLHAQIEERGLQNDVVVGNSLINMHAKCGNIVDAQSVFDRLFQKDVVTWNSMIGGYVQQGMGQEALSLYRSMQDEGRTAPNSVTFVCLLQACASLGVAAFDQGKQLHAEIEQLGVQADVVVGASLVDMYVKCGSLEDAKRVFDRLPQKNVVTWTAMIGGYAQEGMGQGALSLYDSMQQEGMSSPDAITFVCLLQACANVGVAALDQGKELHAHIEQRGWQGDLVVGASLVNMYAKCDGLEDAQRVFDRLYRKDVVTWNAMITGYTQQGMGQKALTLYNSMKREGVTSPDSVTFVCLLQACASVGVAALYEGKQLHAQIEERDLQDDVVVGNSLINMYVKCGSLKCAQRVFARLSLKDVVSWNAIITGFVQQGMGQEALILYSSMKEEGVTPPDSVTFVCLLQACASLSALALGKQLHAEIEERGLQGDVLVGNSLVNMYAKCGSMVESQQVFNLLPERGSGAWGALIGGYTRQGDSEAVFDLVDRMKLEGIQLDSIMFLSVLTVCSHAGLLNKGRKYFEAMSTDYNLGPTIQHYTCMVDLLSRAGHLDEALQMAKTMPFQADGAVWLTLLGACRKWSNVDVGRQAFEFAVSLDEKDAAAYVLMSNIYVGARMWEEAKEVQARRVKLGVWKEQGQSWWTDMDGVVHSFVVRDEMMHTGTEGWNSNLASLMVKITH